MKTAEIQKANLTVGLPDFSKSDYNDDRQYWVRPLKFNLTGDLCIAEKFLAGHDTEQKHPELSLARLMLSEHPMGKHHELSWEDQRIEGIKQGVFLLTDKETGEKFQYAVRAASYYIGSIEEWRTVVLWGWGNENFARFGYFNTQNAGLGYPDHYELRVVDNETNYFVRENRRWVEKSVYTKPETNLNY